MTTALFFELFSGLPQQGPGDAASTLRALSLVPDIGPETRILDIGCGTGRQTRVLAQNSPARIVAIDNHPPFVDELNREARRLGLAGRVEARVVDMRHLDFAEASFDLIWCESAIYITGVEASLRDWHRLLVRGGHVAFTEVCWTKPDPP
ncbi:MAG: class I SAM-dependent methyltransferase, partial [Deltaproteobacteria bacterium]|nr:class I SAM-dependent methyltransferase [Deltaproteobacteria bacterium]